MKKGPTLQNLKKQIMYKSYSRKRIIKAAKFHSQNFDRLARILSKKSYRTKIVRYAKLAPTKRKCFIGWECVSSNPTNHQLTKQLSRKNTNPILKWVLITTIYMQERGSMTLSSQFLTPRTIMRRHPTYRKFHYGLFFQRRKWRTHQEIHMCVPQRFSLHRRGQWRNGYVSTYGTWCGNKLGATE